MPIELTNAGEKVTLAVNGSIGGDVLSAEFQDRLNSLDEAVSEIHVNITTRGGSVVDGHAMFGMLRDTGKRIVTTIIGGAYSAGAVLSQAGDERRMHSNALLMIHGASGGQGARTADEHRGAIDMLEKANQAIAETIADRAGWSQAKAAELLQGKDNWYTAREAKAAGLIDTIINDKSAANAEFVMTVPADILNELGVAIPTTETEEPEIMAEVKTPTPATAKEIKALCQGATADFVLSQVENEATIDQVKDAWMANLAAENAANAAKAVELQTELEKAKAAKASSGVDPVSASAADTNDEVIDDPIDSFEIAVAQKMKTGKSRQQALSAVIAQDPNAHKAYLDAYNQRHGL